jgi:succinoglycan biosynthesis transport protein ExoP
MGFSGINETEDALSSGRQVSLRETVDVVLDKAWIIILILAASAGGGYYYLKTAPVLYTSNASLIVEFRGNVILGDERAQEGRYSERDKLNTLAQTIGRREVLDAVVTRLNLTNDSHLLGIFTNGLTTNAAVGYLGLRVRSSLRTRTRLVDVSFVDSDPEFAQRATQALVEEFVAWDIRRDSGSGVKKGELLTESTGDLKEALREAQQTAQNFLQTNSLSIGENDTVSAELTSLSQQLSVERSKLLTLDTDWKMIQQYSNDVDRLLSVQSIIADPRVASLRETALQKRAEIGTLRERYRDKHPKMKAAIQELTGLNLETENAVLMAPATVQTKLLTSTAQEQRLLTAFSDQERKVSAIQQKRIVYEALRDEAESIRSTYTKLLGAQQQSAVERNAESRSVDIYESATLPRTPTSPRKNMVILASLVIGAGLSVLLIFVVQQLDNTVKSIDEAERMFGIPVLGAVPKNPLIKDDKGRLAVANAPNSSCAEAFRTLRASVALLGREDERKVILFTSAVPSEGKTFCSVNFSIANAKQGKKTLIMDFDLRRPSVGDTFGVDLKTLGVTDVLLGKKTFKEVSLQTDFENLTVIPAGSMVPNPSELISGKHVKKLIDDACKEYDQVVIDNAPVTAVSDTLMILEYVQTVCIVTRAGKTSDRLIGRSLELIRRSGSSPSGLILNFVSEKRRAGYYYYNSDNKYYGYGGDRKS